MKHFNKMGLAATLAGGLMLITVALPGTALAHERRTIGNGKFDVVVGWSEEPAYIGQKNSATIRIMNAGTTTPVSGADKTLKLAIRQGASTQPFALTPVFGQDGYYRAELVPTRVGDYQLIFTGSIGDATINETFDTADGKFNGIEPISALQFPVQIGDPVLSATAAQAAQSDAQSARTLAMVGLAAGLVGLLVGLVAIGLALRRAPRPSVASATTRPAPERV